mmetsp:Transcript_73209/g.136809  ORF Transcript_73209/g.136809 Transcript_73209/m.136809 type:complete len:354 (+) Transcript_73209:77-1138(+)
MLRPGSTRALSWLSLSSIFVIGVESAISLQGNVDVLSGAATLELGKSGKMLKEMVSNSALVPSAPVNGLQCAAKTALRAAAIGAPCELILWQLLKQQKAQQQRAEQERVSVPEALGLTGKAGTRPSLKLAGFIGLGLLLAFVFAVAARRRGTVRVRSASKKIVAVPENQELLQDIDSDEDSSADDRKEDITEFFRIHTDKTMPEPNSMGNFSLPVGTMRAKTEELDAPPEVEFFRMDSGAPQQESYPSGTASGIVANIRAQIELRLQETWKRSPRLISPRIRREPSMPKQLYRDTSELVDEISEQTNSGMMSWQTGGMKRQSSARSQDSNGSKFPTRKDAPGSPNAEGKALGA